ncbi:MAG TPA: hypothetical protein VHT96_05470 [Clostridia bacterium]|nr:hypothetical protein [Clostridia bacterium]
MSPFKRFVAAFLIAVLLYSIISGSTTGVLAADFTPVRITVISYDNGTLNISWSPLPGAKSAQIMYHDPHVPSWGSVTSFLVNGKNNATITGLESDYIYDIHVTVYDDPDCMGTQIGRGLLFYLPSMTFYSRPLQQDRREITGGGYETGVYPKLRIRWREPRIYYPGDNTWIPFGRDEVPGYMQGALQSAYDNYIELASQSFEINISVEGREKKDLIISRIDETTYSACVSDAPGVTALVSSPDDQGLIGFELWGREDENSEVPDPPPYYTAALPDGDILPGTIYNMSIKPVLRDSDGVKVTTGYSCGEPDNAGKLNVRDEILMTDYAGTPIRFEITKDTANNLYIKIYKANQGSTNLPTFYYDIQVDGVSNREKLVGSNYESPYIIESIAGGNSQNERSYKIVVTSDSPSYRMESLTMQYKPSDDSSRPPLPTGVSIADMVPETRNVTLPAIGASLPVSVPVTSSAVTISWDLPDNLDWNTVRNDLYYHFLLSTSQSDQGKQALISVNGTPWGDKKYDVKYRLVKDVSALSPSITIRDGKLQYTLGGFDLFTKETSTGAIGAKLPNADGYPDFLLPNTVYYLQMYTTKGDVDPVPSSDDESEHSIITSFTTLDGTEPDVPVPANLSQTDNETVNTTSPAVTVEFDKITDIDWKDYFTGYSDSKYDHYVYYDIYMNTAPTTTRSAFTLVGTTQFRNEDIGFTGDNDPDSSYIRAAISQFKDPNSAAYRLFGSALLPNTTYYIKVKTRLVIRDKTDAADIKTRQSIFTSVLPVTTKTSGVNPPDENQIKPLAPTDFSIARTSDGNLMVSGESVTFTWTRKATDRNIIYQIIKTSEKTGPTDTAADYSNDPEYQGFLEAYSDVPTGRSRMIITNGAIYLDLRPVSENDEEAVYTFTVDRSMFPNKLYYFSLKAVRADDLNNPIDPPSESVWVSIPVTTKLIDQPNSLEAVVNAELGFFWTDATVGLTAEDYKIYLKGPSDADFKLLNRSQATIVKDGDGRTYYGRIFGLKANTYYDIRVVKGVNTPVYEKMGMKTRDANHELEVMWIGKPLDSHAWYELAIVEEGGSEYTVLDASDLEQYVGKDNRVQPYYAEETIRTINSDEIYYHAKIKSVNVVLPGGVITKQPLKSNTKYYIKVRAVKVDSVNEDFIAYSKYDGPVNIRTEFNQDDYDNNDREEQQKAIFLDSMDQLEKGYYWRVDITSNRSTCILLKGDRVYDAMKNSSSDSFTVDMTSLSVNIGIDEIFVPVSVIRAMNSLNRSLVIKTSGTELVLRPKTLDASPDGQFKDVVSRPEVKDLYLKLTVSRPEVSSSGLPANMQNISELNELDIQAIGLSMMDKDVAQLIHDRLYAEDGGLVSEMLSLLENTYVGSGTGSKILIDQYTQSLIDTMQKELSVYIGQTITSSSLANAVKDITSFDTPASVNVSFTAGSGAKIPYALYDGSAAWQKISVNTLQGASSIRFNLIKTGKFVVMSVKSSVGAVPAGHWSESYIRELSSKYDLSGVFPGMQTNFMPDNRATCGEVVLLYEVVTGRTAEDAGLNIRQKNTRLGLDSILNPNLLQKNIKREETAAVLLHLFSAKKGVNAVAIKPGGRIAIKDESAIGEAYFQPVVVMADMRIMELDENGRFNPNAAMSRAEIVAAFTKLLKETGDL